jgi:general secretion pathway protein D
MTRKSSGVLAALTLLAIAATTLAGTGASSPATTAVASVSRSFDFSANDEPLQSVLMRLGKQLGVNIVIADTVSGRVSVALHHATLGQSLDAILPAGYSYHILNGVVLVEAAQHSRPLAVPSPTPTAGPAVLAISTMPIERAAAILHGLFPHDRIAADREANALIVTGSAEDVAAMRGVLVGIDVADPTQRSSEAIQMRVADPHAVALKLQSLYPSARIESGPNHTILVKATPRDMSQIKAVISSVDQSTATPVPTSDPAEAVHVSRARPLDIARAIAREFPSVRAAVVGSSVVISGPPDAVANAKALVALIDEPMASTQFTQVYRLRAVDATSVGSLISRSFHDAAVTVDADLNAISVTATAAEQQRIADAIAQLDVAPGGTVASGPQLPGNTSSAGFAPGGTGIEVITLKAALPGQNLAASTSASDVATAVTQALAQSAPDLHITVPANSTQLVLTGSPLSIRLAKQLIDQLDVAPPQVVLDTEVLELDETGQKNVGLLLPPALITTYSEIPPVGFNGATPPPVLGIQPWTRTTLSAQVVLNALMTTGHARVLADPRITTISGRTASIRAGDTINFTTSVVGGGLGSVVAQQVQSAQTGVTLDITPIVNANGSISVTLHPTVNSLLNVSTQGIPSIANREAQTTVTLADNQTLVIGGLIQEDESRTDTSVPFLGQLPLIGRLFHNYSENHNRNELIIVVTPHILGPNASLVVPGPALPTIPTPEPLPTLPPGTSLPTMGSTPTALGATLSTPAPPVVPSPLPTPTAFARANEYRYGKAPTNTYAAAGDPPQIFFALFSPTVLTSGTQASVSVITTTNISRVTIGNGVFLTVLNQIAPDKWQAAFNFNAASFPLGSPNVTFTLIASRTDGAAATIQIPVSISP